MRGITIRVYAGYLGLKLAENKGALVRDATFEMVKARLRNIPDADLHAIYRRNYWDMVRGDELPAGVDLAVFDWAVNSGVTRAARYLQGIVGARQDGHIGAATLAAVRSHGDHLELVRKLMAARRAYLRGLDDYPVFGKGWENRCNGIEPAALAMAGIPAAFDVVVSELSAPVPLLDANAQAATQGRAQAVDPKPPWITEIILGTTGLSANVTGFAAAFGRIADMPAPTVSQIALAFLREPLVLTGIATMTAALTTWLWRRRHAQ
jgi:lysozyme family protein